ncbi:chromo domain-containing protein [bacterium]|nr:chromo domain-containing protein [bacterium]
MSDILHRDFQIEKIVKAGTRDGRRMYYIKWKGYSDSENTWEYADDLRSDGHEDEIDAFDEQRSTKRKRKRKSAPAKRKSAPAPVPAKKTRTEQSSVIGTVLGAASTVVGTILLGSGALIGAMVGSVLSPEASAPSAPSNAKPRDVSDDELRRRIDARRKSGKSKLTF